MPRRMGISNDSPPKLSSNNGQSVTASITQLMEPLNTKLLFSCLVKQLRSNRIFQLASEILIIFVVKGLLFLIRKGKVLVIHVELVGNGLGGVHELIVYAQPQQGRVNKRWFLNLGNLNLTPLYELIVHLLLQLQILLYHSIRHLRKDLLKDILILIPHQLFLLQLIQKNLCLFSVKVLQILFTSNYSKNLFEVFIETSFLNCLDHLFLILQNTLNYPLIDFKDLFEEGRLIISHSVDSIPECSKLNCLTFLMGSMAGLACLQSASEGSLFALYIDTNPLHVIALQALVINPFQLSICPQLIVLHMILTTLVNLLRFLGLALFKHFRYLGLELLGKLLRFLGL